MDKTFVSIIMRIKNVLILCKNIKTSMKNLFRSTLLIKPSLHLRLTELHEHKHPHILSKKAEGLFLHEQIEEKVLVTIYICKREEDEKDSFVCKFCYSNHSSRCVDGKYNHSYGPIDLLK